MSSEDDSKFMAEAIEVAEKARFHSSPNPWVGAVVVAKDQIVGEGATGPFKTDNEIIIVAVQTQAPMRLFNQELREWLWH